MTARRKYMLVSAVRFFILLALADFAFIETAAQGQVKELIQSQFDDYRKNNIEEKIFLHTDKDFYLAGEICWLKVYTVDAFFHQPSGFSKVAYAEVLDQYNKPVLQAKIDLKEGFGNGSLQVPVYLVSGHYKLRAYTNWMKNFGAGYFFEKSITIVNTRKKYEPDSLPKKNVFVINFFPEGGNLVYGIQSKIAFRAEDQNGNGLTCEGVIINEKSDTLVKYATLNFGMGNFNLNPQEGHTYTAVTTLPNGERLTREFPIAFKDGYVMHLEALNKNEIRITVQSPPNSSPPQAVHLFAHTRNSIKLALTGEMKNGQTQFLIDKNKLGDGISHFTVFNADRQPVCERLFFKYPGQKFRLALNVDKQKADVREKITCTASASDDNGQPIKANLSMAVYLTDSLQYVNDADITNYLWLSSDLKGKIESPDYYFSNDGVGSEEEADNLMLTQGWRRFRWEDILQNKKPLFQYIPEYAGHVVSGRVTEPLKGLPAKGVKCFLSLPGTRSQVWTSISDHEGFIKFDVTNFYPEKEIIVQTESPKDSIYNIEIFKPFSEKYAGFPVPAFSLPQINASDLANHNISVSVQGTYNSNKLKQFTIPDIDSSAFYFKPEYSYLLDNYVRFTTMEEILREYVLPIFVRLKNRTFQLHIADQLSQNIFENDPLVLLDGVPILDINKIMGYDPLKVRKLDVVTRKYYLGQSTYDGIASFVTYDGNLPGYELDSHATVIDYEGLQLQREFYSPSYETSQALESRLPDFRNLLYWNPTVLTNETGKQNISFYTSDLPGKYVIVLQGLTADGKTGSKLSFFDVNK